MLTLGLTLVLGLILFYMGFYLFTHRTKTLFGVFSPKDDPALKKAMTLWAYILTILGVLTIIAAFLRHPRLSDHDAHFGCDLGLYHVDLNADILTHAVVVLAFIFQINKVK